ncbi:MAG TPA: Maf family protein [Acidobacteriota bacterium]|nr:Maf family protein [Acidobacteriota bacterium]HNT16814.1 Maf family protein [Acidobacteriota bacterium]HPA26939.1 Maf family protein [Acidobacteriota bacterium]HQO19357.1 Maf family protein [Acidobacteriota bacterium]HQQ47394.1 Maf family protein [Acidobacteriota bacterium]
MTRIVLASKSPRRKEILEKLGLRFDVRPSGIDETLDPCGDPRAEAVRLAREKALDVSGRDGSPDSLTIGVDTVVYLDGRILCQPDDHGHAEEMLGRLQGRTHEVYSGLCLVTGGGGEASGCSVSRVTFHPMSEREISWYVKDGEPMDKAGAYGVQGKGALFVKSIEGSFHNVMGFPVDLFYSLLRELGKDFASLQAAPRT